MSVQRKLKVSICIESKVVVTLEKMCWARLFDKPLVERYESKVHVVISMIDNYKNMVVRHFENLV